MNIRTIVTRAVSVAALAVALGACGGSQSPEEEPEVVEEQPSCISDRWARPPEQIGQTPPERFPDSDAIEPFQASTETATEGAQGDSEVNADPDGSSDSTDDQDEGSESEEVPSTAIDPTPPAGGAGDSY